MGGRASHSRDQQGPPAIQFRKFIETGMATCTAVLRAPVPQRAGNDGFRHAGRRDHRRHNYIHPFREGNGRTQLQYLKQLAAEAGQTLDLTRIEGRRWIEASIASHAAGYGPMAAVLRNALKSQSGSR
jgi:cell filamentation protein, protein adenylyltransferase